MRHVPADEFRDRFDEYLDAAEAGEEIVIERAGRRALRLLTASDDTDFTSARREMAWRQVVEFGRRIRTENGPTPAGIVDRWVREDRDR